ncbi:MAG: coproporphyrinogen III oxidase [Proteobacteria bacterium]|nr:coproporphyrinogen III oxidase [Pseudomonadota bacterium]
MSSFGIYIHWPFCESKCPYCDFNSHVQRSIDEEEWKDAIISELLFYKDFVKDFSLKSIFFGGGTPSLMDPKTVHSIIDTVFKTFGIEQENQIEITLEANPHSVEADKFLNFKKAGVNRISVGIQSFNDDALKFLGRKHSKEEALKALDIAFNVFNNVSFDLIYARPSQTLKQWEEELLFALSFQSHHLSVYQLTIEEGTPFFKQYMRKEWDIPLSQEAESLYLLTQNIMNAHNMPAYEVSNHAKAGFECQHNLIYWRYHPFLGIGPGAHGRLLCNDSIIATQNFKSPKGWIKAVQNNPQKGAESLLTLTEKERLEERLLMGLRLFEPIFLTLEELKYIKQSEAFNLAKHGFLNIEEEPFSLQITPKGRFLLNAILQKILH